MQNTTPALKTITHKGEKAQHIAYIPQYFTLESLHPLQARYDRISAVFESDNPELNAVEKIGLEKKDQTPAELIESLKHQCKTIANCLNATEQGIAPYDHPYLSRKQVKPYSALEYGGDLFILMQDIRGVFQSFQIIRPQANSKKLFAKGFDAVDRFHVMGFEKIPDVGTAYICEGFATGASIKQALENAGMPGITICALSGANIKNVITLLNKHHPKLNCIICADLKKDETDQPHISALKAQEATRAPIAIPRFNEPASDDKTDFNDLMISSGLDAVVDSLNMLIDAPEPAEEQEADPPEDMQMRGMQLINASEFYAQPAPIRWLIKDFIEQESLTIIYGAPKCGKTFAILDIALHISSGFETWHGSSIANGCVVYLAGEGHYGLRRRIAVWGTHHNCREHNLWLSDKGCNLNTPEGYAEASDVIRRLEQKPAMIVIDTLHRFLDGNENDAKDAKTMIDACDQLKREFGCSVVLIHHTGVNDSAQDRPRGSSAWLGAVESSINITKPNKGVIEVITKAQKNAEDGARRILTLEEKVIKGWYEEDGNPSKSLVITGQEEKAPTTRQSDDEIAFQKAYLAQGCQYDIKIGHYIRRGDDLIKWIEDYAGVTPTTAKHYSTQGSNKGFLANLRKKEKIKYDENLNGFVVIDPYLRRQIELTRAEYQKDK